MCGTNQRGRNVAKEQVKEQAQETVYQIEVPERKIFNKSTGEWEIQPLYNTPRWVRYYGKMSITDGRGTTTDPYLALEMLDDGVSVTPDPRPMLQDKHAHWLKAEADGNPMRLAELAQFLREANAWRAAHNLPAIDIPVPQVPRAVSALMFPVAQTG